MLPWSRLAWTQGFWDDPSVCCAQWFSAWAGGEPLRQYWLNVALRFSHFSQVTPGGGTWCGWITS